ncbi:6-bladed beta-propeller [bacterium]|nr:6-bladed beta-propeller [bacterium]
MPYKRKTMFSYLCTLLFLLLTVFQIRCSKDVKEIAKELPQNVSLFNSFFKYEPLILKNNNANSIVSEIHSMEMDKENNIYILDIKDSNVKKFNKEGDHLFNIGKRGSGPGELSFIAPITAFCIKDDLLYIYDIGNLRINIYNINDGSFNRSFRISSGIDRIVDIVVDENNLIYLLTVKVNENKLIHVFNEYGERVNSFGSYALPYSKDTMFKLMFAYYEGTIDIASNGLIYLAKNVPVVTRSYSNGELKYTFFRKELRNQLPDLTKPYDLTCPAIAKMKIVDDSLVFNFIEIRRDKKRFLIDIYSSEGEILKADIIVPQEVYDLGRIRHIDDSGNLYFEKFPPDVENMELQIYKFNIENFRKNFKKENT